MSKKCYQYKELEQIKKEYKFVYTRLDKTVEDVTEDVEELWWSEERGFYSVLLFSAGPQEVSHFNIPTEVKMIRK